MDTSEPQRTVIVTGASSGIGRAVCERLLGEGHRVIGMARDFKKFPSPHVGFERVVVDLADLEALPKRLSAWAKKWPQLDAVVFNAGRGEFGGLEEFSYPAIRGLVDLNFTSHAYLAKAFLPVIKQHSRGNLIFIGSEAALEGRRRGAIYCATKFALRGLTQALREECARSGVAVSLINPGMVQTAFFDRLDFAPGEDEKNYILPADVAASVSMVLASREGTVFDEINLTPLKRVIRFRSERGPESQC